MKNLILKTILVFLVTFSNAYAIKKDEIIDEMTKKIDSVLVVLENKTTSVEDKAKQIIPIVNDAFDFDLMAKIALGKDAWASINEEQKKDFSNVLFA